MVSWQIAPAPERRSRAAHPAGENPSSRSARTRHASTGSAIRRLWRGRLLSSSARCWAPTARYRSRPPLRPTSLLMVDASRPRVKAIEANATIGSSTRKARISSRSSGDKAGPGMLWSPSVRLHVCTGHHDRIMHRPMEPAVSEQEAKILMTQLLEERGTYFSTETPTKELYVWKEGAAG